MYLPSPWCLWTAFRHLIFWKFLSLFCNGWLYTCIEEAHSFCISITAYGTSTFLCFLSPFWLLFTSNHLLVSFPYCSPELKSFWKFSFPFPSQILSLLLCKVTFRESEWKNQITMIFTSAKLRDLAFFSTTLPITGMSPLSAFPGRIRCFPLTKTSLVLMSRMWSVVTLNQFQRFAALSNMSCSLRRTLSCWATVVPQVVTFPGCFEYFFLILSFKPSCVSQGSPRNFSPHRMFSDFHFN